MSKNPNTGSPMDSQRKMLIALCLAATAIFMISGAALYFMNAKIVEAQKQVDDKQAQVDGSKQIASKYDLTMADYNSTLGKLRFLEPTMTSQSYVATLIQQLQKTAIADGVQLTAVRPGDATDPKATGKPPAPGEKADKTPPSPYQQLLCAVTVRGTYPQIMKFVYSIPKFPKIMWVQGIALHPSTDAADASAGAPIILADIGLQAYIFDDSVTLASGTAAAPAQPQMVSYDHNPIAAAAGRAVSVARDDMKNAAIKGRSGGILDESPAPHSMAGGLGSEQQVPVR